MQGRRGWRDQTSSTEEPVEVQNQVSKTTLPGPLDINECLPLAVWVQTHCKGEPQVRICEWLWSAANKKPITAIHKKCGFSLHHYHLLFALYGVPFHCLLPSLKTPLIPILCLPPPSDALSLSAAWSFPLCSPFIPLLLLSLFSPPAMILVSYFQARLIVGFLSGY